jgi:hypothetical protein
MLNNAVAKVNPPAMQCYLLRVSMCIFGRAHQVHANMCDTVVSMLRGQGH